MSIINYYRYNESYIQNIYSNNLKDTKVGVLSAKYESNGDPGTISGGAGDIGGVSYGAYQFASKYNIPYDFVKWLENKHKDYYHRLNNAFINDGKTFGKNFNTEWKNIAKEASHVFLDLQHSYVKDIYYYKTVNKLLKDIGFNVNLHSFALKNAVWSRSVQHGAFKGADVIKTAFTPLEYTLAGEETLIDAIYKESGKAINNDEKSMTEKKLYNKQNKWCIPFAKKNNIYGKYMKYFSGNSTEVQVGVWKRLNIDELKEALTLYNKNQLVPDERNKEELRFGATKDPDFYTEALIRGYETMRIEAINNNHFSLVEKFLLPNSRAYYATKRLISEFNRMRMREYLIDYNIYDIVQHEDDPNIYEIFVNKQIELESPERAPQREQVDLIYTVVQDGNTLTIGDIKKWDY